MAALGDAEVDSLPSDDVDLSINVKHSDVDHEMSRRNKLNVPQFQLNVEICETDSTHQPAKERPRSVLSIFRPMSMLSRAKSALSTRSVIPTNVKSMMKRITSRLKKNRSSSSLNTSNSSMTDPGIRIDTADLKRELDSLHSYKKKSYNFDFQLFTWMKAKLNCKYALDPHGYFFFIWMALVFLACTYNYLFIPLRGSFGAYLHVTPAVYIWLAFDYIMDLVYIVDMVAMQPHLSFCYHGVQETNLRVLALRYIKHWSFALDIVSLLPLDLLYFIRRLRFKAVLRLPRLLKFRSISVFMDRFEKFTNFPHIFRIAKLSTLYLYIIHIYTCIYYTASYDAKFNDNWVYNKTPNATFITSYLYCFYWSTLAMATINLPGFQWPASSTEYVLAMAAYLIGIFIVASIIGEISNIVAAANSQKVAFQRRWDHLKERMRIWKIPKELQSRVQVWHDYACSQQLMLDERKVLGFLPKKMKGDIAIHVHLDVLSKVTLFQDCEKTLLRELVLKLRPALFVPGDYICKKGEIGKEMYIVNQGIVQVVGGLGGNQVLAELGSGSVFGEISLLAVGGGNRRTAHVRSKGFSSLLLLSKKDLHETLVDYPDAQETLKKKARYLLKQDKKRERRQSQGTKGGVATAPVPMSNHSNRVARAAVIALTSAARAARERAAATRMRGEVANIDATPPREVLLTSTREPQRAEGGGGGAVSIMKITADFIPGTTGADATPGARSTGGASLQITGADATPGARSTGGASLQTKGADATPGARSTGGASLQTKGADATPGARSAGSASLQTRGADATPGARSAGGASLQTTGADATPGARSAGGASLQITGADATPGVRRAGGASLQITGADATPGARSTGGASLQTRGADATPGARSTGGASLQTRGADATPGVRSAGGASLQTRGADATPGARGASRAREGVCQTMDAVGHVQSFIKPPLQVTVSSLAASLSARALKAEQSSGAVMGLTYTPLTPLPQCASPVNLPNQCSNDSTSDL